MTRNLLWLFAGLLLGFLLAFALKAHEISRLNAANRELASQLESEKRQLDLENRQLESQRQLTEEATATIRLATRQLSECNQALHHTTSKLRGQ
jgi:hypothetical protein